MSDSNRKSTTHNEMYFQLRVPHTSKKGKEFKAATVYARQVDKEPEAWLLRIARCSKEDNYCRKTGRTIAKRNNRETLVTFQQPTHDDALRFYKDI